MNDRRVVAAVWFNEAVCEVGEKGPHCSSCTSDFAGACVNTAKSDDGLAACHALNTSVHFVPRFVAGGGAQWFL